MRHQMKRTLLVGALVALAGLALAQVPATFNLTGNEIVRAGLPGSGSDIAVPVYVLRNGTGYTLVATGTTVNTSATSLTKVLAAIGAITTWNVSLPSNPFDGQTILINCPGGAVGTLTIAASPTPAGTTLVGTNPTSCSGGGAVASASAWLYSSSPNKWYRYQ